MNFRALIYPTISRSDLHTEFVYIRQRSRLDSIPRTWNSCLLLLHLSSLLSDCTRMLLLVAWQCGWPDGRRSIPHRHYDPHSYRAPWPISSDFVVYLSSSTDRTRLCYIPSIPTLGTGEMKHMPALKRVDRFAVLDAFETDCTNTMYQYRRIGILLVEISTWSKFTKQSDNIDLWQEQFWAGQDILRTHQISLSQYASGLVRIWIPSSSLGSFCMCKAFHSANDWPLPLRTAFPSVLRL